jgi:hypothetical protein
MNVKGAALLARKNIITKQFGERVWAEFYAEMASRLPYYAGPVLAASSIPLKEFLAFQDELIRKFYGGNRLAYFALGEQSARWALVDGPYKSFVTNRNLRGFVECFPRTWTTYFSDTDSRCTSRLEGDRVEFEAFDLPLWHPYLEYFVVGYLKGGLELVCGDPFQHRRVRGGQGDYYHYTLWAIRGPRNGAAGRTNPGK